MSEQVSFIAGENNVHGARAYSSIAEKDESDLPGRCTRFSAQGGKLEVLTGATLIVWVNLWVVCCSRLCAVGLVVLTLESSKDTCKRRKYAHNRAASFITEDSAAEASRAIS